MSSLPLSIGDAIEEFDELIYDPENEQRAERNFRRWLKLMLEGSTGTLRFLDRCNMSQLNAQWILWPIVAWVRDKLGQRTWDDDCEQYALQAMRAAWADIYPPVIHEPLDRMLELEFSHVPESDFQPGKFASFITERRLRVFRFALCVDFSRTDDTTCDDETTSQAKSDSSTSSRKLLINDGTSLPAISMAERGVCGPTYQQCPWLGEQSHRTASNFPRWLWDKHMKRTRTTESIISDTDCLPDYIAISHTWGRYKKQEPWILVGGIPWEIPLNSRFEVRELPTLLDRTPATVRYVWIDLACIYQVPFDEDDIRLNGPDVGSDGVLKAHNRKEIAKQASIFRNASTVICWLSDIMEWKSTRGSLRWFSHELFQGGANDMREVEDLNQLAKTIPELWESFDTRTLEGVPHSYFTSLWTLQESALRPDMILCNHFWEPLRLNGDRAMSLGELTSLIACAAETRSLEEYEKMPFGPIVLEELFKVTGMIDVIGFSRLSLLSLGNQRHCQNSRAEAIMSVLGCTDWFNTRSSSDIECAANMAMIMGKYPSTFVEEIRCKIGSGLFFSAACDGVPFLGPFGKLANSDPHTVRKLAAPYGSLLPFGIGSRSYRHALGEDASGVSQHETATDWQIQEDGSVGIRVCAVSASSSMAIKACNQWLIHVWGWEIEAIDDIADLGIWAKEFMPEFGHTWAVCLFVDASQVSGIILKEILPNQLVNVGNYAILHRDDRDALPTLVDVEWRVL